MRARLPALAIVVAAGAAATLLRARPAPLADADRLTWAATAHQHGPVAFRDPVAAISPDGLWIAYSEGRFVRVQPTHGGAAADFPPGGVQIRHLAWSADSRTIIANADPPDGWMLYDRVTGTKRPMWTGTNAPAVRQVAWSRDGRSLVGLVSGREGTELRTFADDGAPQSARPVPAGVSYPTFTPAGAVACVLTTNGHSRITVPCGGAAIDTEPPLDIYGPIAFSPDGDTVYGAAPNDTGTLDLWKIPARGGAAARLTASAATLGA